MIGDGSADPVAEEGGFILVAVLWILAALAILASIYSVYADNVVFASHINDDRLNIRAAVSSAIELAAYRMNAAPDDHRPPRGSFALRLAHSTVGVTFLAEGARVDLNLAPKPLLAGLFTTVGASPDDAASFADRVVGWRKANDGAAQNDEAALYKSAGYAYAPRQAPFQSVLELSLVLGLPTNIVARVLPLVTVFSGHGQIDVRVGDYEVLAALPEATPDQIKQVMAQRAQRPQNDDGLLKLLGSAQSNATIATTPAFRVDVEVRLDNGRRARAEVVILVLKDDDQPFRVLSWRDDGEGPL